MAKIALAVLFLLFAHAILAQVSLISSNATYGGTIYLLATANGSLANGSVRAASPSNLVSLHALNFGQAKLVASELGEWHFYFMGETASSYVSDAAPLAPIPASAPALQAQDALPFAIAISLAFAAGIAFASFLAYDFLVLPYATRESFDGREASALIAARSRSLHDVSILFDGEAVARKRELKKGESLNISIERRSKPEVSFIIGGERLASPNSAPAESAPLSQKRKLLRAS